jgi:hypothetical protein
MIINSDITLESIIDQMHHDISFSKNGANGGLLIATGAFIFNKNAKPIFEKCLDISNTTMLNSKLYHWYEMGVINHMYENGYQFDVFDMNVMNSYGSISVDNPDLPNLFLYHFQGRSDVEKTRVAKEVYNKFFKESV